MSSSTSPHSVTIKTDGMYLAALDALSPANTLGKWDNVMRIAHNQSILEPYNQMLHFNSVWSEYAATNHLLTWTFNFDGVYRVDVVVLPSKNSFPELETEAFVGVEDIPAQLWCPSGKLIITSLHSLGNPSVTSLDISPGLYEALLVPDWKQQDKHQFLKHLESYPDQDGPDWILYIAKTD